jgi:Ca2+:H+ antiporter
MSPAASTERGATRAVAAAVVPAAIPIGLRVAGAGSVPLFLTAVAALIPLAWAIGSLTEQLAERAGAAVAALLNATLGNAPELIIALVAIAQGLPQVVQASLAGSVAANVLLVLGLALLVRRGGSVATPPAPTALALIALAAIAFAVPSADHAIGGSGGMVTGLSVIAAVGVSAAYVVVSVRRLAVGGRGAGAETGAAASPGRYLIGLLSIAMLLGVGVADTLVGSLEAFARSGGLNGFFLAAVVVALVGNAVEHSAAVVLARRGRIDLAAEIAISSGAQVAALLIPAAVLAAPVVGGSTLRLGAAELAAVGVPAAIVALVLARRASRGRALVLVGSYATFALVALVAGVQ